MSDREIVNAALRWHEAKNALQLALFEGIRKEQAYQPVPLMSAIWRAETALEWLLDARIAAEDAQGGEAVMLRVDMPAPDEGRASAATAEPDLLVDRVAEAIYHKQRGPFADLSQLRPQDREVYHAMACAAIAAMAARALPSREDVTRVIYDALYAAMAQTDIETCAVVAGAVLALLGAPATKERHG